MTAASVAIYLAVNPLDCRVLLNGTDISQYCRGIDVHAHVSGGATVVTLHLLASVEVIGEAGTIQIWKGGTNAPNVDP